MNRPLPGGCRTSGRSWEGTRGGEVAAEDRGRRQEPADKDGSRAAPALDPHPGRPYSPPSGIDAPPKEIHPAFVQPFLAYHARFASPQDAALKNQTASSGSTLGGGCSFFAE